MRISDWSSDVCSSDLLFRHHLVATLAGTFAVVACFAIFYLATSFALAHGTTALGYPKEQFLLIQLGAILFMAVGIVIAGYWSDVSGAQRVLTWGCGATILMGLDRKSTRLNSSN